MEKLDLDDIQGLLARGYGRLKEARFLLLRFNDRAAGRAWLRDLVPALTPASADPRDVATHIAFTRDGLTALGFPDEALQSFSIEFRDGMTTPHRQRVLGDTGANAPDMWRWGGPANDVIHATLLLYAADRPGLDAAAAGHLAALAAANIDVVANLETSTLGETEHFGFRDGISQPVVDGIGREGLADHTISPGEFVLGYPNEYRLYTDRPLLAAEADPSGVLPTDRDSGKRDFGRNGSYFVVRQLEQHVSTFWQCVDARSQSAAGGADPAARTRLAAKMVGRWPGGAPLAVSPEHDDPTLTNENDFGYHDEDADGMRCPVGAHVRRANPRDSLDPDPGSDDSIKLNKRHRILRRGRAYGDYLSLDQALAGDGDRGERGLFFACLVGNIARQFEFVQHTWANNPKFAGMYDEVDPITGPRDADGATFSIPAAPVRQRVHGLPEFVTVRGGAYFFMPGIRAVRYLASLA